MTNRNTVNTDDVSEPADSAKTTMSPSPLKNLPHTLRLYLAAFGLVLSGSQQIEAFAATITDELGWQRLSNNIYLPTEGTVSVGDNTHAGKGKLIIQSSDQQPSIILRHTSGTSQTNLRIQASAAPFGSWDIATANDGPARLRLRVGGNATSTTLSILGESDSPLAIFSNGTTNISGTLSVTGNIKGKGTYLTGIPASALSGSISATVTSATSATSATQLAQLKNIKLSGVLSGTARFNGSEDIILNVTIPSGSSATFRSVKLTGNLNGNNGTFSSGGVVSNSFVLSSTGTANAPALAFTDASSRTGIFLAAKNLIAIATSGRQQVRITSAGRLGIGTTTEPNALNVSGSGIFSQGLTTGPLSANSARFSANTTAASFIPTNTTLPSLGMYRTAAGDLAFSTSNNLQLAIKPAGNVGIGTANPTSRLHVQGDVSITGTLSATTLYGDGSGLRNLSRNELYGVVPARNFLVESAKSNSNLVDIGGYRIENSQNIPDLNVSNETGYVTFKEAEFPASFKEQIEYRLSSDIRLKQDFSPIHNPLEKMTEIGGVSFLWNRQAFPDRNLPHHRETGFIAQEVGRVFPHLVITGTDGFKRLDYPGFIAIQHEGIKSLKANYDRQTRKTATIEEKIRINDDLIAKSDLRFKSIESIISPNSKMPVTGIYVPASGTLGFSTNGVQRMVIDGNGNVGIGTQNPAAKLDVQGDALIAGNLYQHGGAYTMADTDPNTDAQPIDDALTKITRLTGYSFKWKKNNQPDQGVIAQEVEKVFPELVRFAPSTHSTAPPRLMVNYNGLVAPLVESIKALKAENEKLEETNTTLEKRFAEQVTNNQKRISDLQKSLAEQSDLVRPAKPLKPACVRDFSSFSVIRNSQ